LLISIYSPIYFQQREKLAIKNKKGLINTVPFLISKFKIQITALTRMLMRMQRVLETR